MSLCDRARACIATLKPSEIADAMETAQEVIESREAAHGDYTKQAVTAQHLKRAVHIAERWQRLNSPQQESVDMICVKLSRIVNGNPEDPDHWTDIAGYATLISNLLTKGTHL